MRGYSNTSLSSKFVNLLICSLIRIFGVSAGAGSFCALPGLAGLTNDGSEDEQTQNKTAKKTTYMGAGGLPGPLATTSDILRQALAHALLAERRQVMRGPENNRVNGSRYTCQARMFHQKENERRGERKCTSLVLILL